MTSNQAILAERLQASKSRGDKAYVYYRRQHFPVSPPLTGLQIRELLGVGFDHELYIADSSGDDPRIEDSDKLDWTNDLPVYATPRKINQA